MTNNSALQKVVDAAKQEGQLNLVWGTGNIGDTSGNIDAFVTGFNNTYGTAIKVNYTIGPSMAEFVTKTVQAVQGGRAPDSDLVLGYGGNMYTLSQGGALQPTDWSWAPNIKDPAMLAPDGMAVTVQDGIPGITYNTKRLTGDQVPHSMQDLLKPAYKGHLASTPYAAHFSEMASDQVWGDQKLFDWLQTFGQQLGGFIRCNETDRIASGEFDALALDCSQNLAWLARDRGAPVDFVVPSDAAMLDSIYLAVPKGSAHPNAAKLFVNYMVSTEAQALMYKQDLADTHFVPGSQTALLVSKLQAQGVKFTVVDLQWLLAQGTKQGDRDKRANQVFQTFLKK
ncbi:MAG: extracellular solute-binding protein [Chloroflexi bacterium]|nr:extracellular solute-binding protein [Chloroflexota bacterium]